MIIAEIKNETGQVISQLQVMPKQFKTGSRGYYTNTKVEIDGKRYQVQIQMVEIGSKPGQETE